MTTFPQDLTIHFRKGVNVLFGCNHSGKTTVVNSIKYSIFGLSWNQAEDNVEKKYFTDRIKEIDRSSLDIATTYSIKQSTFAVKRIVFLSGRSDLSATISVGNKPALSNSYGKPLTYVKDYSEALRIHMGLIYDEQVKFVPNLMFSDENRQPVLWTRNLKYIVKSLLIPDDCAKDLRLLKVQLDENNEKQSLLRQKKEELLKKRLNEKNLIGILRESLKKIRTDEATAKEYQRIEEELKNIDNTIAELNTKLHRENISLDESQDKLARNQKRLLEIKKEQDGLADKLWRVYFNTDDPNFTHLGRLFYYDKICPFCASDLSKEIDSRIEGKKCPICGIGPMPNSEINVDEIKSLMTQLKSEEEDTSHANREYQSEICKKRNVIKELSKELESQLNVRIKLLGNSETLKENYMHSSKKQNLLDEVLALEQEMKKIDESVFELENQLQAIDSTINEISEKERKTIEQINRSSEKLLTAVYKRFSEFIYDAKNKEVICKLNEDFIPVWNGREIFHSEQCSASEANLMDIAFRIAFLSVLAENSDSTPSLVLETPDDVIDEAYISHFADTILKYSSNLIIIISTVRMKTVEQLLRNEGNNVKLISLISGGNQTQRKFYEPQLSKFSSFEKK